MNLRSLSHGLVAFLTVTFIAAPSTLRADPIKIGVPSALTGDAASFGQDLKNALTLANETLGGGRYELIFEDERCTNKDAASIAHKLIDVDKVRYALGFPCNGTLLATAPIYDRAGVLVITASATSGDVLDLGQNIFRLFPSDTGCSRALQTYVSKKNKKIAIITEQNEYPVMMERSFTAYNSASAKPLEIRSFDFMHGSSDFRTIASKIRSQGFDAVFLNANTDTSFIDMVKQLGDQHLTADMYSAYLPGSKVVLDALGSKVNGYKYCNLPISDDLVTARGKEFLAKFRARFGEPQSGFPVVPSAVESFRLLDLAIQSGQPPADFLRSKKFSDGFIPEYWFDHGAIQGIDFQMQVVRDGKVEVLKD